MPDNQILVLNPSGVGGCVPDQEPWEPVGGSSVEIRNDSGSDQTLTNISQGLLAPAPHREIQISTGETWSGQVGNIRGTYTYEDGLEDMVPRTGTIDPS